MRLRIGVRTVLFGAFAESTVTIYSAGFKSVVDSLAPGNEVIAWGVYDYTDRWHLWGGAVVKVGDRLLLPDKVQGVWLAGMDPDSAATYEQVLDAMRPRKEKHASASYEHSSVVGMVRVRSVRPLQSGDGPHSEALVDSLGWLYGAAASLPDTIDLPRAQCTLVEQGDTLLVPLARAFAGRHARLTVCPDAILVKNGHALGFGIPLPAMSKLLRDENGEITLPAIVSSHARGGD